MPQNEYCDTCKFADDVVFSHPCETCLFVAPGEDGHAWAPKDDDEGEPE